MKHKFSKQMILSLLCVVISVVISLLLPTLLLHLRYLQQMNKTFTVSQDQYQASKTTLAKNMSSQMTSFERLQMINGSIASTVQEVDKTEGTLTEVEAVQLAKQEMEFYYENGFYPYSIMSYYGNWYNYSSQLYCYTDTIFDTYTCYVWDISFVKYDSSISHRVLMTEDGVILAAKVNNKLGIFNDTPENFIKTDNFMDIFHSPSYFTNSVCAVYDVDLDAEIAEKFPGFENNKILKQECYTVSLQISYKTPHLYMIYQYNTDNSFGIGILEQDEQFPIKKIYYLNTNP